ncbi:MAG: LysR family transcriptional regulator, partial [Sandaracinus sp.]|nr:LysR family transcriptional regulator [Sandaracinus sp.]
LLGLTLRPLPIEAPPIPVALFCSERVAHEPGTAWLREKVAEVVGPTLK